MPQKIQILICLLLSVQLLCDDATECENNKSHHGHQQDDGQETGGSCSRNEFKTENVPSGQTQRTFCMVKPDGIQRNLIGEIIKRYEAKGLKLVALKFLRPKDEVLRALYHNSAHLPFFEDLIRYMKRGPVVPMVWEGHNAVKIGRQLLTGGNKSDPVPGSIRGDFSGNDLKHRFTVAHGSESVDEAESEIYLWFDEEELISWYYDNEIWIYQK